MSLWGCRQLWTWCWSGVSPFGCFPGPSRISSYSCGRGSWSHRRSWRFFQPIFFSFFAGGSYDQLSIWNSSHFPLCFRLQTILLCFLFQGYRSLSYTSCYISKTLPIELRDGSSTERWSCLFWDFWFCNLEVRWWFEIDILRWCEGVVFVIGRVDTAMLFVDVWWSDGWMLDFGVWSKTDILDYSFLKR